MNWSQTIHTSDQLHFAPRSLSINFITNEMCSADVVGNVRIDLCTIPDYRNERMTQIPAHFAQLKQKKIKWTI